MEHLAQPEKGGTKKAVRRDEVQLLQILKMIPNLSNR